MERIWNRLVEQWLKLALLDRWRSKELPLGANKSWFRSWGWYVFKSRKQGTILIRHAVTIFGAPVNQLNKFIPKELALHSPAGSLQLTLLDGNAVGILHGLVTAGKAPPEKNTDTVPVNAKLINITPITGSLWGFSTNFSLYFCGLSLFFPFLADTLPLCDIPRCVHWQFTETMKTQHVLNPSTKQHLVILLCSVCYVFNAETN